MERIGRTAFATFGGRKLFVVLLYITIVALDSALGWGISAEAFDKILIAAGGFVGIEGARDVAAAVKSGGAREHDLADDYDDDPND